MTVNQKISYVEERQEKIKALESELIRLNENLNWGGLSEGARGIIEKRIGAVVRDILLNKWALEIAKVPVVSYSFGGES
tara:strand:- start:76 stop:312 length:237 start_codon:yes stop_codon:yes gene_type:complete